jgi:hypothetical protein
MPSRYHHPKIRKTFQLAPKHLAHLGRPSSRQCTSCSGHKGEAEGIVQVPNLTWPRDHESADWKEALGPGDLHWVRQDSSQKAWEWTKVGKTKG